MTKAPAKSHLIFTGVKLDRGLLKEVKKRAKAVHQTYSEYVRQLIVKDTEVQSK
jgi:hypothetical protein